MRRLWRLIGAALPGVFLVGFTVGTGSVTSMVKAGADYGMSLLWALVLSCLVSFVLFDAFGRLTAVSGKTALEAIRRHIHPALAVFILAAVAVNVSGSIMGVMGIIADVLYEWSIGWWEGGVHQLFWAVVFCVLIVVLLLAGSVRRFEKLLAALAAAMGVCFLINAVLLFPPPLEILAGLIPRIPTDVQAENTRTGLLVAASMVGTTIAPVLFLFRSILVKEEGWTVEDQRAQRRDALLSAAMILLISAAIMASASGSLHGRGVALEEASEMISLLRPLAGSAAVLIFVVGITAAGVSSQFPNVLTVPWLIRDFQGRGPKIQHPLDRSLVVVMTALGLVVPVFHARPVFVMVASQALGAVVLPVVVLCLIYLLNSKPVVGEHRNTRRENLGLALIALFSLFMSGVGLLGLLGAV